MKRRCKYCGKKLEPRQMGGHVVGCKSNPNRYIFTDSHREKLSLAACGGGHPQSEKSKLKISKGMKLAVKEGRAVGWKNHHKLKNSYAENFFIEVINNEFNNKNYTKEYRMGKYSIDFAWPDLKLAIEIDGSQHNFPDRKKSDKLKDKYLKSNNWKVLRIKWIELFHETKRYISIAKNFIDSASFA